MRAAFGSAIQRYSSRTDDSGPGAAQGGAQQMHGWRSSVTSLAKRAYEGGYERVSSAVRTGIAAGSESDTWRQWWDRRKEEIKHTEKVALFPGFAVRRYYDLAQTDPHAPFSVDLFVDGYVSSLRPPELATRSQKAFLRIAKGFAALPKLPASIDGGGNRGIDSASVKSDSDSDFEEELKNVDIPGAIAGESRPHAHRAPSINSVQTTQSSASTSFKDLPPAELARYHANLDMRLQPFWSSNLANRTVKMGVYIRSAWSSHGEKLSEDEGPLAIREVMSDATGYFKTRFRIDWETLCHYPPAVQMIFNNQDPSTEHYMVIKAELLPPPPNPQQGGDGQRPVPASSPSTPGQQFQPSITRIIPLSDASSPTPASELGIPLTTAKVRLISDIDDTVKRLDLVMGAKTIFRNIFVHPLEDLIVPGMPEWYQALGRRGVQVHYVSNSPFELLTVLQEFFEVSGLPRGHLKLKQWGGGRSLLTGLWEDAANRKRSRVLEVLDDFAECKFFLVGDTGEQDLELYSSIARERPNQILGVFVRDVTSQTFISVLGEEAAIDQSWPTSPGRSNGNDAGLTEKWDAMRISDERNDFSNLPPSPPAVPQPVSPPMTPRAVPALPPRPPIHPTRSSQSYTAGPLAKSPPASRSNTQDEPPSYENIIRTPPLPPPPPPPQLPYRRTNTNDRGVPTAPGLGFKWDSETQSIHSLVQSPQPLATPQMEVTPRPSPSPRPPPRPMFREESSGPSPPGTYRPQGLVTSDSSCSFRKHSKDKGEDPQIVAAIKKREEFKLRVEIARATIPEWIALRVFREPEECGVSYEILEKMGLKDSQASGSG